MLEDSSLFEPCYYNVASQANLIKTTVKMPQSIPHWENGKTPDERGWRLLLGAWARGSATVSATAYVPAQPPLLVRTNFMCAGTCL